MDEQRALDAIRAILDRPEFAPPPVDPWLLFWAAVGQLVSDFLDWLFSPVRDAARGHADLTQLGLLALALGLIAVGAWFVTRAVRANFVSESAAAAQGAAERRRRSDRLWTEAQELARVGRYADAVRSLYLSALYALEERDVLGVQEGLTNREHADRLVRLRPGAGAAFVAVVAHYDRLRYGGAPADAGAFAALSDLVSRARALSAAPHSVEERTPGARAGGAA